MTYTIKPLGRDPARIKGMSERLIVSHYENNYGGTVKRLNLMPNDIIGLHFHDAARRLTASRPSQISRRKAAPPCPSVARR